MLIVLEGLDGSGKSYQANMVKIKLNSLGYKVIYTSELNSTFFTSQLKKLLVDPKANLDSETSLALILSARIYTMRHIIEPAILNDTIVVLDRYMSSTIAYQCGGEGVEINTIEKLFAPFNFPEPTCEFFLDYPKLGDIKERLINRHKDKYESKDFTFFERVNKKYKEINKKNNAMEINCMEPKEDITKTIVNYILKHYNVELQEYKKVYR